MVETTETSHSDVADVLVLKPSVLEMENLQEYLFNVAPKQLWDTAGVFKIVPPDEWVLGNMQKQTPELTRVLTRGNELQVKQLQVRQDGSVPLEDYEIFVFEEADVDKNGAEALASQFGVGAPENTEVEYWEALTQPQASVMWREEKYTAKEVDECKLNACGVGQIVEGAALLNDWKSTNVWNSVPDLQLEYVHRGAPKQWYVIDRQDNARFSEFVLKKIPNIEERDKTTDCFGGSLFMIWPETLVKENIRFKKFVQREGELVGIVPDTFFSGFTYGFNVTERTHSHLDHSVRDTGVPPLPEGQEDKSFNFHTELNNDSAHRGGEEADNDANTPAKDIILSVSAVKQSNKTPIGGNTFLNINDSISGLSTPFLSKMMEGSNGFETTLDDSSSSLRKKMFSPKLPNFDSNLTTAEDKKVLHTSFMANGTLNSDTPIMQKGMSNNTSSNTVNNYNGSNTSVNPTSLHSSNVPSAVLEDNDDNMLGFTLQSMADSDLTSSKLNLPPLLSPINDSAAFNQSDPPTGPDLMDNQNMVGGNGYNNYTPNMPPGSTHNMKGCKSITKDSFPNSFLYRSSPLTNECAPVVPNLSSLGKTGMSPTAMLFSLSREDSKSPITFPNEYKSLQYSTNDNSSSSRFMYSLNSGSEIEPMATELYPLPSLTVGGYPPIYSSLRGKPNFEANIRPEYHHSGGISKPRITTMPVMLQKAMVSNSPSKFSPEEIIISPQGKTYICVDCKRTFSSGHHLTRHKKSVHSFEKPHSCPKCGKKFKRRDHVLQHLNKKIPCTQEGG
ncbi:histone demethylase GIS1 KNAG_0H03010 [Huiozyma naganishii CBS 8797]|uniref:C2H2-type domain-containing protein n=1 Tax=Huiozyma naganishii (strain ATCC MYA-139 / BCRC 22969 / CBS 8797 / KCTC 17520 / NBRC 10181 / NCYC 3082 / Yp74L-3) TaxID=1071383 RepID=J7S9U5_HUIN7|nr:hypothetical protein KNAG_0H03010 [Kazachstania naganishii CBS 8797]CCK71716.1 hypothetical protein KNAG_0H03010 [Kazachstania naganishii CBS 8797]